ncbi:hypothetical protein [Hymenobacter metallicola]|uniref:hypothetical protein n=1 Tax=Hymenobacter metallicola TaxID=2563114 RepID=UPI0014368DC1|nr:hypothetical protein [Hymenobacter metallicola]
MNDTTLAQPMLAAAPVATRNGMLYLGAGVGMARVAQGILDQNGIRDCASFLINCSNVI